MSQEIIKVLEYLGDKLGIAIDWTAENIIPYAEELFKRYITLKITYASIGTFIGLVVAIIVIILLVKLIKGLIQTKKENTCTMLWDMYKGGDILPSGLGLFVIIVTAIGIIMAIIVLGINITSLIDWIIIPEIEFVKDIKYMLGTTI